MRLVSFGCQPQPQFGMALSYALSLEADSVACRHLATELMDGICKQATPKDERQPADPEALARAAANQEVLWERARALPCDLERPDPNMNVVLREPERVNPFIELPVIFYSEMDVVKEVLKKLVREGMEKGATASHYVEALRATPLQVPDWLAGIPLACLQEQRNAEAAKLMRGLSPDQVSEKSSA